MVEPHFHKDYRIEAKDLIPNGDKVSVVPTETAPEGTETQYLNGSDFRLYRMLDGAWRVIYSIITDALLSLSDITTNNVSSTKHGFAPKSPADAQKFLNGDTTPAYAQVKDSDLSVVDTTTNNLTTSKHGFAPKAPNDTTKFLRGDASWATLPVNAVTLKTSTTSNGTQSVTISELDLDSDFQYFVICRYIQGNSLATGTGELEVILSADTGTNYYYAYQGYSNNGGGARSDAASSSSAFMRLVPNTSIDADGHIFMWLTAVGSGAALMKFSLYERNPGAGVTQTIEGGGYYGGGNTTSIKFDYPNGTGITKNWSVYVYKLSTT